MDRVDKFIFLKFTTTHQSLDFSGMSNEGALLGEHAGSMIFRLNITSTGSSRRTRWLCDTLARSVRQGQRSPMGKGRRCRKLFFNKTGAEKMHI